MKLRTKFAVALVVLTLVLSTGVYGGLELYKQRLIGDANQEVNETATLTAEQIDAQLEQKKDFIGFVASQPRAADFEQSDEFLTELLDNSRFFAAQIVTDDGRIEDFNGDITQDIRLEAIGRDISNRCYVQKPLEGEVYISQPEVANATGKPLVVISAPIFDDRDIKGVLAAAIYIDRQTVFTMLRPLETSGQSVGVRSENLVLYSQQATFDQKIQSTQEVEATGWTITVVRDRSGLISRLRDLAIAQGVGIFLLMLAMIGFGVWEYRSTLGQTEQLLAGFSALEEGDYEWSLDLATAEEWEQISQGFNELAETLASREKAIHQREQRLQVLNRVLRHNLRNRLGIVIGYADSIREWSDDDEVDNAANNIIQSSQELENLSKKARHIESLTGRIDTVSVDVVGTIEAVIADINGSYPEIDVTSTLPEEAWVETVHGLEMAIENICENACEHNDSDDPFVDITVTKSEEKVRIEIADNGPGIPEYEWAVLIEEKESALKHGSGLGLWLTKWVIDQSGGDLNIRDNKPRGSVVSFELDRIPTEDDKDVDESVPEEKSYPNVDVDWVEGSRTGSTTDP